MECRKEFLNESLSALLDFHNKSLNETQKKPLKVYRKDSLNQSLKESLKKYHDNYPKESLEDGVRIVGRNPQKKNPGCITIKKETY